MEVPFFVKCEPAWSSDQEESSNAEQLPCVKYEDVKVEPSTEEENSMFVKEEHLAQEVERDCENDRQLPDQIQPLLHTTTLNDSIIMPHEPHTKQIISVGDNSDFSFFESVGSNVEVYSQEKRTCDCCSMLFKTKLLLEKHVSLCRKNGQISSSLNSASESVPNGENFSSCDGCGKLLVRQCLHEFKDTNFLLCLQCHSRAMSRSTEQHICSYCGKKLTCFAYLKRHLRTHTGLKPYSCSQCGRAFSELGNLKRHEISHTGIRAYSCTYCEKKYTLKCSLKTHLYKHEGKPFQCTTCGKSFSAKWILRNHAARHNRDNPLAVLPVKNPLQ